MKSSRLVRAGLRVGSILFLIWLARNLLLGGFRQHNRSRTIGQKVETFIQLECGALSLLVMLTSFRWQHWARPVRFAWGASLVTAAGLSALVWGPAMPSVAVLFAAAALFITRAVLWMLCAFPPISPRLPLGEGYNI